MPSLHLAPNLPIPLEAVTQTFAILAKRGSGKTYTALVMVEEMLKAGLQTVVVDPVGVCWGLRAAANEKDTGLPIIVLGGDHGDVTIEATSGAAIAEFIVEEGQSAVLDLSNFSGNEMIQFVTDFAETLYHKNRSPLHLVVDEADAFIPQKPLPGEQRMLGAMDKIVRRGRARGLGVTVVTQRPAVIHKNVLTQIEVLITLRLVSPQDRKAIEAWIEVHGTPEQRDTLMESLASLPIGTAWVSSPGWLGVFKKVKIRQRETFDSSATPKIGEMRRVPVSLAQVDLTRLRERIRATIVQSHPEDPKHLRQHIVRLENQLRDSLSRKTIEEAQIDKLKRAVQSLEGAGMELVAIAQELSASLTAAPLQERKPNPPESSKNLMTRPYQHEAVTACEQSATIPQQRILDALAELKSLGLEDVDRNNLAVLAGQSPKSSGFGINLGSLRNQGLIDYPAGKRVALTNSGVMRANPTIPVNNFAQLHAAWYGKLSKPQARILKALIERYPSAIERNALADISGHSVKSSGYGIHLGALRSLGVITYPKPGQVAATKLLFPAIGNPKAKTSRSSQLSDTMNTESQVPTTA
jgi:hypothetical protein